MLRREKACCMAVLSAAVVVLGLLVSAPSAAAATFTAGLGKVSGTSDDWGNNNGMSATQVTVTAATHGGLTGVSVYVGRVNAAPANHMQVAVYADAGNMPGAKLVASGSRRSKPTRGTPSPSRA